MTALRQRRRYCTKATAKLGMAAKLHVMGGAAPVQLESPAVLRRLLLGVCLPAGKHKLPYT